MTDLQDIKYKWMDDFEVVTGDEVEDVVKTDFSEALAQTVDKTFSEGEVFNGKVIVSEGAQQTDSNQSNKNLLLSLESNAFSNPQLEIYADDVSCGHGSTTGALDENSIFYLRARGIDYSSAQKILIKAFAKEVIDDFSLSSLQDISEIALDSWIDG